MRPSFSCPGVDRFLRSSNAGAFVCVYHRAIFDTPLAVHVHRARTVEEREYGAAAQALSGRAHQTIIKSILRLKGAPQASESQVLLFTEFLVIIAANSIMN
jgi:hypothetical protein